MKTVRPEKEIRQDLHTQLFAMHLRWEDWKEKANAGIPPHMTASATKYSACSKYMNAAQRHILSRRRIDEYDCSDRPATVGMQDPLVELLRAAAAPLLIRNPDRRL
jgi:hypothetical protein